MPRKLIISDSAGVCFGVEKAVTTAEEVLSQNSNKNVKSFGPLIHNPQVVDILKNKGLSVVDKIDKNSEILRTSLDNALNTLRKMNLNESGLKHITKQSNLVRYFNA